MVAFVTVFDPYVARVFLFRKLYCTSLGLQSSLIKFMKTMLELPNIKLGVAFLAKYDQCVVEYELQSYLDCG